MQCNYSEINGHVLAQRGSSRRPLSHVAHDYVHPLKQGLHMLASFVVLTTSLSAMYFTVLVVSDIQQADTFRQSASIASLDRDIQSPGHYDLAYSDDV